MFICESTAKRFLFCFSFVLFYACSKDHEIGKWSDNIHLSKKTATLKATKDSVVITAKGNGWWLNGIGLDSTQFDLSALGYEILAHTYNIGNNDFRLSVTDNKTIKIIMFDNPAKYARHLTIRLQAGDYFDGIEITQAAAR